MQPLRSGRRLIINVGGVRFETSTNTLQSIRDSKLSSLDFLQRYYEQDRDEYFFDRNPTIFSSVLDLHRTGHLHLPSNLCGIHTRNELEFWGISLEYLDECCWKTFYSAANDIKLLTFLDKQFSVIEKQEYSGSLISRIRQTTWRFFENPRSSKLAMIWYWIFMATVFISITIYLLDTYEVFREETETSVFRPIGKQKIDQNAYKETAGNMNPPTIPPQKYYSHDDIPELEGWKIQAAFIKAQGPVTWIIDILCNLIFSIEFMLRLFSCPSQKQFWLDILNLSDFLSLCGFVVILLVQNLHKIASCDDKCYSSEGIVYTLIGAHFMLACRNLRFFRICRINKALKFLLLSIDRSKKDIALLVLVLVIMSVVFAGLVYYAEIQDNSNFEYFHTCLFWAFTTMLMGGYSSTIPTTDSGCVIAACCGLVGVIMLSMVIAVISGNFGELFARNKDRERHAKEKERENNSQVV